MRVLVAGDRGYLVAANVPLLQGASHQVRLDADRHDGFNFWRSPSGHDQRTEHIRDVHAHQLVDFAAVVNLAAISKAPVGDLNPEATCSMNWDGAVHLGRGANAAGASTYMSSCTTRYGVPLNRIVRPMCKPRGRRAGNCQ